MVDCVRVLLLNISVIIGEAHRQGQVFVDHPNCQQVFYF